MKGVLHHMNVLDRGDAPSHTWDVRPAPEQAKGRGRKAAERDGSEPGMIGIRAAAKGIGGRTDNGRVRWCGW